MAGPPIVFFEPDSAALSATSRYILDLIAENYRFAPSPTVEVGGHSDEAGPDAYNFALSRRRAEAVRRYLASRGIPRRVMRILAYGEWLPLDPAPEGRPNSLNRRVEVIFHTC
jgi:outer membrane protein OmpA-like peptidoglycan-associated protein